MNHPRSPVILGIDLTLHTICRLVVTQEAPASSSNLIVLVGTLGPRVDEFWKRLETLDRTVEGFPFLVSVPEEVRPFFQITVEIPAEQMEHATILKVVSALTLSLIG